VLYRLFCFAVFVFTVVYAGVLYGPAPKFPAMFTNWTYVLWGFTSIYGAALTAQVRHVDTAAAPAAGVSVSYTTVYV
jgi:hypothetical protein